MKQIVFIIAAVIAAANLLMSCTPAAATSVADPAPSELCEEAGFNTCSMAREFDNGPSDGMYFDFSSANNVTQYQSFVDGRYAGTSYWCEYTDPDAGLYKCRIYLTRKAYAYMEKSLNELKTFTGTLTLSGTLDGVDIYDLKNVEDVRDILEGLTVNR